MNKIKLLSKLEEFFDSDKTKQQKSIKEIESVLKKLKSKQLKTKKQLFQCKNQELAKALQLEIDVIDAQIEKAEGVLNQSE